MTMKVCAKRLGTKASQVYPLAEPIGYRDATDNNKLQPYLRINRNAANEFDNEAAIWAQNLNDILGAIKTESRPQPGEDWSVQEIPSMRNELPRAERELTENAPVSNEAEAEHSEN